MKALINAKIFTSAGKNYDSGMLLFENGKIIFVGPMGEVPANCEIIDVKGAWVTPGLIDAHTHISTFQGKSTLPDVKDGNEYSSPVTPYVSGLDAINPEDIAIDISRSAGFTTVYTGPGSANLIGGLGCSIKLRGRVADEMLIPGSEMMKFALGENPKRFYGLKGIGPITRMGNAALIRKALSEAKAYDEAVTAFEQGKSERRPDYNFEKESLRAVVRGEQRCRIHAHRADDIMTAVRLGREYGLDFIIEHATEGWKIADILAREGVRCVVGPLLVSPVKLELWDVRLDNAAMMHEAGVFFALMEDASTETQWLPMHLGIVIRAGLPWDVALAGVTINAAKILKLEDRVGSLEAGKDADFAIFNGDPFMNYTRCLATYIDGVRYENEEGKDA